MSNLDAIIHHLTNTHNLSSPEAGNLVAKNRWFVDQELGKYTHHSMIANLLMVRRGFGA